MIYDKEFTDTLRRLAQKVFSSFFGRVAMVLLAKHLDRNAAVSALIAGFLFSKAATMSSTNASRLVYQTETR